MLHFSQDDLIKTAERLLELAADPIPRYRLLRDVLGLDPTERALQEAADKISKSRWISVLRDTQQVDGTWGRFHTRDSRLKVPFPTTELAVTTALDCGLDRYNLILINTMHTIQGYAEGKYSWPDPAEKHDNPQAWEIWVRHISAAVLSLIDPEHQCLNTFWEVWAKTVTHAFEGGCYDRIREIEALNDLMKCKMKDPMPFHKKYPLLILSATNHQLPSNLEIKVLDFVMQNPGGIYYVYNQPISQLPPIQSRVFWRWIRAHQLLSRLTLWRDRAETALNWIWSQRTEDGFWDSGRQTARKPYSSFPLSEDWKRSEKRLVDCSVETLTLLSKVFDR